MNTLTYSVDLLRAATSAVGSPSRSLRICPRLARPATRSLSSSSGGSWSASIRTGPPSSRSTPTSLRRLLPSACCEVSRREHAKGATFDDLRAGQWVAWHADHRSYSGHVRPSGASRATCVRRWEVHEIAGDDETGHYICPLDSDTLVILRDAPEPPVKVRREDFDALVAYSQDGRRRQRLRVVLSHRPRPHRQRRAG